MSIDRPLQDQFPREAYRVTVADTENGLEQYFVGYGGVTRVTIAPRNGHCALIPYVEVWKGDKLYAEFCQTQVQGVFFDFPEDVSK